MSINNQAIRNIYTTTSGNKVILRSDWGWPTAVEMLRRFYQLKVLDGHQHIVLDFTNVRRIFPNGVVPIIAEVDRMRIRDNMTFSVIPPEDVQTRNFAESLSWLHYLDPNQFTIDFTGRQSQFALRTFSNAGELNDCINLVIEVCLKELFFAVGVPQAFEWALNELAGNILVHAGIETGWLQVLINRARHRLDLILMDAGVGIPHNIYKAFNQINSDRHAIEHAIKKGVTTNPEYGQGNGLAGSVAIAQASKSTLYITSGKGRVEVVDGRIRSNYLFPPVYGTCVEMQFNTDNAIDLPKALWGHEPVNYFETKYENDQGNLRFLLKEHADNFGNRPTGEKIRTLIINLLQQNPGKTVLIDMENIGIIASSFADELFGKLAVKMGILDFANYIKLIDVNPICKSIIDVAINQRIVQNYGAQNITLVNKESNS